MIRDCSCTLQFCGFGGQGIVLASVVMGTAAVTRAGLNAVQTQSYGSEARGGECQAELTLSDSPIDSPLADSADVLVALSPSALGRYIDRLRPGGTLVIDPDLVQAPGRSDIQVLQIPASRMAQEAGAQIAANMAILGFLQAATDLIAPEELEGAIADQVRPRFLETNLRAARSGMAYARQQGARIEV